MSEPVRHEEFVSRTTRAFESAAVEVELQGKLMESLHGIEKQRHEGYFRGKLIAKGISCLRGLVLVGVLRGMVFWGNVVSQISVISRRGDYDGSLVEKRYFVRWELKKLQFTLISSLESLKVFELSKYIEQVRLLRCLGHPKLTDDVIKECIDSGNPNVQRQLVARADIEGAYLSYLKEHGANKKIRNIAGHRLRTGG